MASRLRNGAILASLLVAFSAAAIDTADARRGGSFGSRGARTYQAPPPTSTAPTQTAPVQRSMTQPGTQAPTAGAAGAAAQSRGGLFGGIGGGLLGGLALGGLFGMMMGHGFGGLGGMFAMLVQVLLLGLGIMLIMRLFRRNSASRSYAGPGRQQPQQPMNRQAYDGSQQQGYGRQTAEAYGQGGAAGGIPGIGSRAGGAAPRAPGAPSDAIGLTGEDFDVFERRLGEVQAAFSREDYGTLRTITTPEVMGYLSEELGENATAGRKNDVSAVKLLQGDLAEAWREGNRDFATVAMRYESIDVMRDRQTRAVIEGDPTRPSETAELWTFVRENRGDWKLSAIQEA